MVRVHKVIRKNGSTGNARFLYLRTAAGLSRSPLIGLFVAVLVAVTVSCAKMAYPPGGPLDTAPPTLVSNVPDSFAVNVPRETPVLLEFSEPMDTKSVDDNLFIVPIPPRWPDLNWRSRDRVLELKFSEPLLENTTYVISVGAKARDQRRNPLDSSLMLCFSTGGTIENRRVRGKLASYTFGKEGENVTGVDVIAYRIGIGDTPPDPRKDVPDYFTQSGSSGEYEIVGLSGGTYRLFAVGDKDRNGFYSEGYDMIGVAPRDIVLAAEDSVVWSPDIAVSECDTSGVQLFSLNAPDARHIDVFFDRSIVENTFRIDFDGIEELGWFVPPDSPRKVTVLTAEQTGGAVYSLERFDVRDIYGNGPAHLDVTPTLKGNDVPDTTRLRVISFGPSLIKPGNEPLLMRFNRILDTAFDMTGAVRSEPPVELIVERTGKNGITVRPSDSWPDGTTIALSLDGSRFRGVTGNTLEKPDSMAVFRIVSADTLGFIEGAIADRTGGTGPYRIQFRHMNSDITGEMTAGEAGRWETGPVLPGAYLFRVFRDEDENGILDRGAISPYRPGEQVYVHPDTLTVMSRWTNSDNTFVIQ